MTSKNENDLHKMTCDKQVMHIIKDKDGLLAIAKLTHHPENIDKEWWWLSLEKQLYLEEQEFKEGDRVPGLDECKKCKGSGQFNMGSNGGSFDSEGIHYIDCEPCNGTGKSLLTVGKVEIREYATVYIYDLVPEMKLPDTQRVYLLTARLEE